MMMFLYFPLALAMVQGVLSTPGCDANNCARAVTGTRTGKMPDVTSRMQDCSSYMLVTVTPATSTVTAYSTVTDTITLPGLKRGLRERQVTVVPSSIPVYASACSTPGAYSSACSCWGINAMTTTAPTPVTTTTITVTATATACPVPDTQCGAVCYNLNTDPNNCGACGNVCSSGVCDFGTCTTPACAGETCNGFTFTCSPNPGCACFQTSEGTGACGSDNTCFNPSCSSTNDCPPDSVCVINSCCGSAGSCSGSVSACGSNSKARMLIRDYVNGTLASLGTWVD